ncbi:MAG: hypothetical protein JXB32_22720 [Deltaproteobacteria bacterium]|nr:hypothetical protein [Deltaproteobacteria bacterium]
MPRRPGRAAPRVPASWRPRSASRLLLAALAPALVLDACRSTGRSAQEASRADAAAPVAEPSAAEAEDLESHLRRLRPRVPAGFTVVPEPPFVVIGEGPPGTVRGHAATVRWAVRLLREEYFDTLPSRPLDVWLFEDEESYRAWAWKLFRDRPATPYGYFSPAEQALVMNIATGGGTLVHEVVHPLIHADFPDVPPWFNECLASLYEQSGERDGRLVGYPNWRLPALQRRLREGRTIPLERLVRLSTSEFYERGTGLETAEARYVCLYLQEQDRLARFYREFRATVADDPTGVATLLRVTGEPDLASFEEAWTEFVLGLTPP